MRATNHGDVKYEGYDHTHWPDHRLRVMVTGAIVAEAKPTGIIDPACGDGGVVAAARKMFHTPVALFGDIAARNVERAVQSGYDDRGVSGDAVQTLHDNRGFSLCILSEIIEHVQSPDALVAQAYGSADILVASSPIIATGQWDGNEEHRWMFNEEEYRALLERNGWKVEAHTRLSFPGNVYDFQIVRARK